MLSLKDRAAVEVVDTLARASVNSQVALESRTELAQLRNGYDTSAYSVYRKLRWDTQYMRKRGLTKDLGVIYRTVIAVLKGEV